MTTTIVPSAGAGILFTQQGVGTTPGFAALDDRRSSFGPLQEGVLNASDFMVVQRGAGANLSVDVGMPTGGFAWVQGDTITGQGLYCVPVHSATINETIATADGTNPRIDQVILEVFDNVIDASGNNLSRTRVLTGTPTGGATLTNRSGAAALPGSALLLADVLVPAADTTIDNTQIRDRRKWARGAFVRQLRNTGTYTTTSATLADIDGTNLSARLELSGVPTRVSLRGRMNHTVVGQYIGISFTASGLYPDGATSTVELYRSTAVSAAAGTEATLSFSWEWVPAAGSSVIRPQFNTGAATATILASATFPVIFEVEELVRQNSANNTTTSG